MHVPACLSICLSIPIYLFIYLSAFLSPSLSLPLFPSRFPRRHHAVSLLVPLPILSVVPLFSFLPITNNFTLLPLARRVCHFISSSVLVRLPCLLCLIVFPLFPYFLLFCLHTDLFHRRLISAGTGANHITLNESHSGRTYGKK